jgi:hypothetical protein
MRLGKADLTSEGSKYLGWVRLLAAPFLAMQAWSYSGVPGDFDLTRARALMVVLAVVLAFTAILEIKQRGNSRTFAAYCLAVDVAIVLSVLLLNTADPSNYSLPVLLAVQVEAVVVFGLFVGMGVWVVTTIGFVARELAVDPHIGIMSRSTDLMLVVSGALVVLMTGVLNRRGRLQHQLFAAVLHPHPRPSSSSVATGASSWRTRRAGGCSDVRPRSYCARRWNRSCPPRSARPTGSTGRASPPIRDLGAWTWSRTSRPCDATGPSSPRRSCSGRSVEAVR